MRTAPQLWVVGGTEAVAVGKPVKPRRRRLSWRKARGWALLAYIVAAVLCSLVGAGLVSVAMLAVLLAGFGIVGAWQREQEKLKAEAEGRLIRIEVTTRRGWW